MYPNLLMKRANLTPNRIALRYNEQEWTFAQLSEEAIEFRRETSYKRYCTRQSNCYISFFQCRISICLTWMYAIRL